MHALKFEPVIDQIERKRRSEIVAAAFDQHQFEPGITHLQKFGRLDVQRRILADHRMRAGAGLDRQDPFRIDKTAAAYPLGVLARTIALTDDQKQALLSVYRSYVQANRLS